MVITRQWEQLHMQIMIMDDNGHYRKEKRKPCEDMRLMSIEF